MKLKDSTPTILFRYSKLERICVFDFLLTGNKKYVRFNNIELNSTDYELHMVRFHRICYIFSVDLHRTLSSAQLAHSA